jgi:hypothetical protein
MLDGFTDSGEYIPYTDTGEEDEYGSVVPVTTQTQSVPQYGSNVTASALPQDRVNVQLRTGRLPQASVPVPNSEPDTQGGGTEELPDTPGAVSPVVTSEVDDIDQDQLLTGPETDTRTGANSHRAIAMPEPDTAEDFGVVATTTMETMQREILIGILEHAIDESGNQGKVTYRVAEDGSFGLRGGLNERRQVIELYRRKRDEVMKSEVGTQGGPSSK